MRWWDVEENFRVARRTRAIGLNNSDSTDSCCVDSPVVAACSLEQLS
jgi:hypothetical protein